MVYSGLTSNKRDYIEVSGVEPDFSTAHAILLLAGKYVLQLRDDSPTISAPGQWSLFGGRIDPGESALEAIKREISEELNIRPSCFVPLWSLDYYDPYDKTNIRTWFFSAEVSAIWEEHKLAEGKAVDVFAYERLPFIEIPLIMRKAIDKFHNKGICYEPNV